MYGTILVAIDDSETASATLEHAIDLADAVDARLHVLSVVEPENRLRFGVSEVAELDSAVQGLLDDVVDAAEGHANVDAAVEIRRGEPAEVILEYGEEIDADLVVIGQEGDADLSDRLLGSTIDHVARESSIPVTLVPRSQAE